MSRKSLMFFLIYGLLFVDIVASAQDHTNPHFNEFQEKVFDELNPDPQAQKLFEEVAQDEKNATSNPAAAKELQIAKEKLSAEVKKSKGIPVFSDPNKFAEAISNDLKSDASSKKVVGFLAGYSAAGHNEGVIKDLNVMQANAAEYFKMDNRSSYSLLDGASMDGGINQRLDEALKNGKFIPAGSENNFRSYGAVSVNIGEYGGLMTSNKADLLSDTPAGVWELKPTDKSSSQNPMVLAMAAKQANANVHIMLTEAQDVGIKEVLEYITSQHDPSSKALIHLGIGYEPTNLIKDKGIRGASFFAKFLSQNPEMIDEMERKGIKLMVVDAKTGNHYSSLRQYFKSPEWKFQAEKFKAAEAEKNTQAFADKKAKLAALDESAKSVTDKDEKKKLATSMGLLKEQIAAVENRANYSGLIGKYLGEVGRSIPANHDRALLEKMSKAATVVDVAAIKASGKVVDPSEAAKAAAKALK